MNVKQLFVLVGVFMLLFTGLGAAQVSQPVLSEPVSNAITLTGTEIPDEVVEINDTPSFIISVSDGKNSSLENWSAESDKRSVESWIDNETAVVSAPPEHIVDRGILEDSGLVNEPYIGHIGFNYQVSLIEPVDGSEVTRTDYKPPFVGYLYDVAWGEGKAFEANDTTLQTARENMGVGNVTETGAGVTVGIVDTGLNYNQTLYEDRVVAGKNFITGETIDKANGSYEAISDGNGHGSWVASSIASSGSSSYAGVAPDADLVIAKGLTDNGSAETGDIVRATEWACEQSDIVSMSLGSPMYSEELASTVQDCVDNGTVVVVAVGNAGYNPVTMYVSTPSDTPNSEVIAVGATTNEKPSEARMAYFSEVGPDRGIDSYGKTTGERPTIAAPGMSLQTEVVQNGSVEVKSLSGTSMATPLVSGNIALLLDSEPNLTTEQVYERIGNTSKRMDNAGKYETQYGMINAERLVTNTESGESQINVRSGQAQSRDLFYEMYSGNRVFRTIVNILG